MEPSKLTGEPTAAKPLLPATPWIADALVDLERLRAVIDALAEGAVVQDVHGTILSCNSSAARILGLSVDQMMGRTSLDPRWRSVHEDGTAFPGETHPAMVALSTGEPQRDVVMGVHKPDGSLTWISINAQPLVRAGATQPSAVVVTFTDITASKRVEAALRRERELLRVTAEKLPIGFYVLHESRDEVLHFNDEFCRLWGFPDLAAAIRRGEVHDSELMARALQVVESRAEFLDPWLATVRSNADINLDDFVRMKDGRTLRRFSTRLRDADGGYIGSLLLFEDVTLRLRAEEERRTFDRRMHELQKLESLGVMAGGIAHDFNNLLMSIIGNAAMAELGTGENEAQQRYLARILEASMRAAELCKKLLAYTGAGHVLVERTNFSDAVQDTWRLMQPTITTRIQVDVHLASHVPSVLADPVQLAQIVTNLVSNACEAYGDNGGRVRIATGSMQADREFFAQAVLAPDLAAGEYVWLEVEDFGCGMDAATQARIFEPFFSTKFTGRGLGLSAVLGIVRGHRGAIHVDSRPGKGTRIRVLFPRAP